MVLSKFNIDGSPATDVAGQPYELHKADDWESMYKTLMQRYARLQHELEVANQKISDYGWQTNNTRWGL